MTLRDHGLEDFEVFEDMVAGMRFVIECTKVSGPIDYLVRFICPDISASSDAVGRIAAAGAKGQQSVQLYRAEDGETVPWHGALRGWYRCADRIGHVSADDRRRRRCRSR